MKILLNFHLLPFGDVGGITDKRWIPLCVREGRKERINKEGRTDGWMDSQITIHPTL